MTPAGPWREVLTSPAQEHDLLVVDLDGVVYIGGEAVPGAVEALGRAHASGVGWVFATNNASRTPAEVAAQLDGLGLAVAPRDVVTSAQAGAALVVEHVGAGARVLAVGGPGVAAACRDAGLEVVAGAGDSPRAVVQGYGPDVSWQDLAEATVAVRAGAVWVATNTDMTIPTDRGIMPGNGTLVAAVRQALGTGPLVAGKPEPGLFLTAAARAGADRPLVVGDRLDTDIAGAVAADQVSLLVLTGVTDPSTLLGAAPGERPDLVSADLAGLHAAHPAVTREARGWRCRRAHVHWDGDGLDGDGLDGAVLDGAVLDSSSTSGTPGGDDALDLLRAACAAVWERSDAQGPTTPRLSAAMATWLGALGSAG